MKTGFLITGSSALLATALLYYFDKGIMNFVWTIAGYSVQNQPTEFIWVGRGVLLLMFVFVWYFFECLRRAFMSLNPKRSTNAR